MISLQDIIHRNNIWPFLKIDCLWVYRKVEPASVDEPSSNGGIPFVGPFEVPHGAFFVEKGKVLLKIKGEQITCKTGNWFFANSCIRHQYIEPGTKLLSIAYEANWLGSVPLYSKGLNIIAKDDAVPGLFDASLNLFYELYGKDIQRVTFNEAVAAKQKNLSAHLQLKAIFYTWYASLARVFEGLGIEPSIIELASSRAVEVAEMLRKAPLNTPVDKTKIAARVGLSWRRVEQLFLESMGITPHGFFEQRRLAEAKRLLFDSDLSMKEIAFDLGFKQPSGFTIWFNRLTQTTPSQYRVEVQLLTRMVPG